MAKRREIRNSTAEFLIFQIERKGQGIEVYYKDKTVWCTQKAMGMLFDCSMDNVGLHLKNIFTSGELVKYTKGIPFVYTFAVNAVTNGDDNIKAIKRHWFLHTINV